MENKIKLTLSKKAIEDSILRFEIGYDGNFDYYNKFLSKPTVPAASTTNSGVTIGIGYDCGYYTSSDIINDWSSLLPKNDVELLAKCAGKKKEQALAMLNFVRHIMVPIDVAKLVFYNTTIHKFSKFALSIWPNLQNLHPVEQAVLVGLVYNRGNDTSGERRKEMKQLKLAIEKDNDKEMADLIRSMKRLWKNVKGLVLRREKEAQLIEMKDSEIDTEDVLEIVIN